MLSLFPALLLPLAIAATTVKGADAFAEPEPVKPHRQLRGRFLHITDMHPDQHYLSGASMSSHCHRNRPRRKHVRAGYFGTPFRSVAPRASDGPSVYGKSLRYHADCNLWVVGCGVCSECDSPWTLTNLTLDHLEKEWAHNIDFVICTSPLYCSFFEHPRCEADAS
jgi:endopolyphosphatase